MTLRPWLILIESELSALLPERQYVLFNADAVVRADLATRYAAYQIALGGTHGGQPWMTVNEVRALEDLPPVKGGDKIVDPAPPAAPAKPADPAMPDTPPNEPQRLNGHKIKELERV
jgi:hypothetical protein